MSGLNVCAGFARISGALRRIAEFLGRNLFGEAVF